MDRNRRRYSNRVALPPRLILTRPTAAPTATTSNPAVDLEMDRHAELIMQMRECALLRAQRNRTPPPPPDHDG